MLLEVLKTLVELVGILQRSEVEGSLHRRRVH